MGFNGVRKHQKIEDPRYLYWADRLGLLVWEEMPSAYRFTRTRDQAHGARMDRGDRARLQPSVHHRLGAVQRIVGRAGADRRCRRTATRCEALYHLTQDARRDAPGDRQRRLGEHRPPTSSASTTTTPTSSTSRQRYGPEVETEQLFDRRRPGGRILTLDGYPHRGQPIMLTEFGGIAFADARRSGRDEDLGLHARSTTPRVRAAVRSAAGDGRSTPRCSAASATRSSPTPSRKRTACCTRTARRRSRSRTSPPRRAACATTSLAASSFRGSPRVRGCARRVRAQFSNGKPT